MEARGSTPTTIRFPPACRPEIHRTMIGSDVAVKMVNDPSDVGPAKPHHHLTLALDADETFVCARYGAYVFRPNTRAFLRALRTHFPCLEVILWTAGCDAHASQILRLLGPDSQSFHYAICRGGKWYSDSSKGPAIKDLDALPRPAGRSMIADNSPYAAFKNRTAVIVPDFSWNNPKADKDDVLARTLQVIADAYIAHNLPVHSPVCSYSDCGDISVPTDVHLTMPPAPRKQLERFLQTHPYLSATQYAFNTGPVHAMHLNQAEFINFLDGIPVRIVREGAPVDIPESVAAAIAAAEIAEIAEKAGTLVEAVTRVARAITKATEEVITSISVIQDALTNATHAEEATLAKTISDEVVAVTITFADMIKEVVSAASAIQDALETANTSAVADKYTAPTMLLTDAMIATADRVTASIEEMSAAIPIFQGTLDVYLTKEEIVRSPTLLEIVTKMATLISDSSDTMQETLITMRFVLMEAKIMQAERKLSDKPGNTEVAKVGLGRAVVETTTITVLDPDSPVSDSRQMAQFGWKRRIAGRTSHIVRVECVRVY